MLSLLDSVSVLSFELTPYSYSRTTSKTQGSTFSCQATLDFQNLVISLFQICSTLPNTPKKSRFLDVLNNLNDY